MVIALGGLATFTAIYLWVMWPFPLHQGRGKGPRRLSAALLITTFTLLVFASSVVYGSAFAWLFLTVSAISGVTLPARRAFWVVTGLTLFTLGVSIGVSGGIAGTDWLQVIPLVLLVRAIGLDMTGLTRLAQALEELNQAHQELARLAEDKGWL
jgi:hypothetical protein